MAGTTTFLLCFLLVNCSDAVVRFSSTWLYDQIDLEAAQTPLDCSKTGCYVYASLPRNRTDFEHQICIARNNACLIDLSSIAHNWDAITGAKIPFRLAAGGPYSILNMNTTVPSSSVVMYAISKKLIDDNGFVLPIIYEPLYTQKGSFFTNRLSFMSAEPFTLTKAAVQKATSMRIHTAGPDVFLNDDANSCFPIYVDSSHTNEAFILHVRSPFASIDISTEQKIDLELHEGVQSGTPLLTDGLTTVVTSFGFIGCMNMDTFRWRDLPNKFDLNYTAPSNNHVTLPISAYIHSNSTLSIQTDEQHLVVDSWDPNPTKFQVVYPGRWLKIIFDGSQGESFAVRISVQFSADVLGK